MDRFKTHRSRMGSNPFISARGIGSIASIAKMTVTFSHKTGAFLPMRDVKRMPLNLGGRLANLIA